MSKDAVSRAAEALQAVLRRDGLPSISHGSTLAVRALLQLHSECVEVAIAYWLDKDLRLLGSSECSRGAESETTLSTRYLCRLALEHGADHAVIVHSHPSGDPTPSETDKRTAGNIDRAMAAIGIVVLGHYAVGTQGIGDIRTGQITRLADLADQPPPTPGPRCPHCQGLLT